MRRFSDVLAEGELREVCASAHIKSLLNTTTPMLCRSHKTLLEFERRKVMRVRHLQEQESKQPATNLAGVCLKTTIPLILPLQTQRRHIQRTCGVIKPAKCACYSQSLKPFVS